MELDWWTKSIDNQNFLLKKKTNPDIEIKTDASASGGLGVVCMSEETGGR